MSRTTQEAPTSPCRLTMESLIRRNPSRQYSNGYWRITDADTFRVNLYLLACRLNSSPTRANVIIPHFFILLRSSASMQHGILPGELVDMSRQDRAGRTVMTTPCGVAGHHTAPTTLPVRGPNNSDPLIRAGIPRA